MVFETHGATHSSALNFLNAVGGHSAAASGAQEKQLISRNAYLICFNAILISKTYVDDNKASDL